ncbi:ABC transporter permease subunit [Candidatus Fermentibacteria bacterium]|nr:ABC transporter permease subunit [Candidatus Fermentibacteria bacterium]
MSFRAIGRLYGREMTTSLREKTVVMYTIVLPVVLYPLLMWVMFSATMLVRKGQEREVSRISMETPPEEYSRLTGMLHENNRLEVIPCSTGAQVHRDIASGRIDAHLSFSRTAPDSVPGAVRYSTLIGYNSSLGRSKEAANRLRSILESYRNGYLRSRAIKRGISPQEWRLYELRELNLSTGREMGSFLLGMILPMFFVVMVAVSCFYTAVDSTAGERERSTWETLMSTGVSRFKIISAKYMSVMTLGTIAGLLNVLAMTLSMKMILGPVAGGDMPEFSLPLQVLPLIIVSAVLLAGFVGAGMMLLAVFARNFKEGQAMIQPFYIFSILPIWLLMVPGVRLTEFTALVPVASMGLLMKEAVLGTFEWPAAAVAVLAGVLWIMLFLKLAAGVIQREEITTGDFKASPFKRLLRSRR